MHNYEFKKNIPVAIVGVRGYAGLELARVLLRHPAVKLHSCFASQDDFALSDYLPEPEAASVKVLPIAQLSAVLSQIQVVFLATPAEVSLELAPKILASGVDVIDMSGAFRLDSGEMKEWYGLSNTLLDVEPHYGLVPWAESIAPSDKAKLISNPGCYATAVLLALLPLLKGGLIDPTSVAIDAKSGTTGAGRRAAESLLFSEVSEQCLPYKVGRHQHLPEIRRYAAKFASTRLDPFLTTHLLPVRRGILAGIYARTIGHPPIERIEFAFSKAYQHYPLLHWGRFRDDRAQDLSLRRISGSARTEIRFELNGDKLYVFSVIDNLLKGSASQAVENFNRLHHLPVTTALTELEGVL